MTKTDLMNIYENCSNENCHACPHDCKKIKAEIFEYIHELESKEELSDSVLGLQNDYIEFLKSMVSEMCELLSQHKQELKDAVSIAKKSVVREFVNRLLRRAICVCDGPISTLVHVEDVCEIGDDILLSEGEDNEV